MPDIPGDTSTTASISVGGSVSDSFEVAGDHDWYAITLTAGEQIRISLGGSGDSPVSDTYLYLRDSSGDLIDSDDDGGPGLDSSLFFTVPTSGTYYIDAGSYGDFYAGTYTLSVEPGTLPPEYTHDQIGNQLSHGYWSGDYHHFDVAQGESLTVNITGLTDAGQTLARTALAHWSDIIGVDFDEVDTGGQITFDDDESGAFSTSSWSNHIISASHVNVSTQWLASYGTELNSYSFQTYVHEIGHALGLGHAGDYNGSADYPDDALFANDSWATSIMSYFSQTESDYFFDLGFTYNYVLTPMIGDILAMQTLYGLSTTTRTGDTTYGFNSNAGRDVFDAALYPDAAYTIHDSGGADTLDYSGFADDQLINLNSETYSNVGGYVGNVMIGRGVTIENAIGGSGSDTLIGNLAGNQLYGGDGNDTFDGRAGSDVIYGGSGDDTIDGGYNADQLFGEAGTDILIGSNGHDVLNGGDGQDEIRGGRANDQLYGGIGDDDLDGGLNSDSLYGEAGNDTLIGGDGHDSLFGGDGDDLLKGGRGIDRLEGGAGRDSLFGGLEGDTFAFGEGDIAGATIATADIIHDFSQAQGDLIDLSALDSNSILGGDQAFAFVGGATFSGAAGELRFEQLLGNTYVSGDTDGDGIADFRIQLDGLVSLTEGDFLI